MTFKMLFFAISIVIFLRGCGGVEGRDKVVISGTTLYIPKRNIVSDNLFFLPKKSSENVTIMLRPELPSGKQVIVNIESYDKACFPVTPPKSNQLEKTCAAAKSRNVHPWFAGGTSPIKSATGTDNTQWEYRIGDRNRRDIATVASCHAFSDQSGGLCTALGNYKGMIYSVILDEGEIGGLVKLHHEIRTLLSSWDR